MKKSFKEWWFKWDGVIAFILTIIMILILIKAWRILR